jgi:hypothetical protein
LQRELQQHRFEIRSAQQLGVRCDIRHERFTTRAPFEMVVKQSAFERGQLIVHSQ